MKGIEWDVKVKIGRAIIKGKNQKEKESITSLSNSRCSGTRELIKKPIELNKKPVLHSQLKLREGI